MELAKIARSVSMDALYVFITTALPKAGAQVAGLPLTLNLLLTAYVILRHPNQTLLMMQRFRGLAMAYGALFASGLPALSQGRMSLDIYGNGS